MQTISCDISSKSLKKFLEKWKSKKKKTFRLLNYLIELKKGFI